MCRHDCGSCVMNRRAFLQTAGLTAAAAAIGRRPARAAESPAVEPAGPKGAATIRAAFLYPPTEQLRKQGYYSWPGSGFDAEGHHRLYAAKTAEICKGLGMRLVADDKPLYGPAVDRFIAEVKARKPDGLLLVAFKKSEWANVKRIIVETGVPTVAMATIGVLLMPSIQEMQKTPGVFMISSLDNFDAIRDGLNMVRARRWLAEALILSVADGQPAQSVVPVLGTRVRGVPMKVYAELLQATPANDDEVRATARAYTADPRERREPSEADILEAARAHVALLRLIRREKVDAMMMKCLDGITARIIPPPCMSFMDLRDAGVVAGCQNDLDATLTMMIGQQLFGRPGFQHNPACDTTKNLYYGSHCTSPRKLEGPGGTTRDYIVRSHAEAGIGTVPQVLWPEGADVTVAQYVAGEKPELFVYTGKTVANYDTPPAGGCRTSLCATLNEIPACDVKPSNMLHPTLWTGNHAAMLKSFCQMHGIAVRR